MRHLLAARHRARVAAFLARRPLLAFDFDGTLAPITADRHAAAMRPRTEALLAALCARHPVAVVSGRSLADLRPRLGVAAPAHLIGNHGIEPGERLADFAAATARARTALVTLLPPDAGIEIEDKGFSLALHYRRAGSRAAARAAIATAFRSLPEPLQPLAGKLVVNGLPPDAPRKGAALRALCARSGHGHALYVGDDVTDEDVFASEPPPRLLSVRIGRHRRSAAAYHLRRQRAVDALLALLLELAPPRQH